MFDNEDEMDRLDRLEKENGELMELIILYRESHYLCIKGSDQGICNKCERAERYIAKKGE